MIMTNETKYPPGHAFEPQEPGSDWCMCSEPKRNHASDDENADERELEF